jgi:hypothetical protein
VSIAFESGSPLSQLGAEVFRRSALTSIHLAGSVTVIGQRCFSSFGSLLSITVDSASKFRRNVPDLLAGLRLGPIDLCKATALLDH